MKNILLIISILILSACGNTIGSDDVNELTNLEFTIVEKETTSTALKVQGSVKNTGSYQVSSPWYIEGMFYTDTTFTTVIGGKNKRINIPLESGVTYNGTLSYSSNDIIESEFPYFGFRHLRGYINE